MAFKIISEIKDFFEFLSLQDVAMTYVAMDAFENTHFSCMSKLLMMINGFERTSPFGAHDKDYNVAGWSVFAPNTLRSPAPMFDSNLLPINQTQRRLFALHANMRNYARVEHLV